ncbi:Phosphatidylinositol N-acetylglucosaminyltransferase GPI3 subunit [Naganishia albida]|nr:Phosphatidylinositol N-acetylglucosaminyltransferase GPI3 subunit [Naganishia albida]
MPYNIALVSDFFLPAVGGVEVHIYSLGIELQRLGHKVIVITHSHPPERVGIRYLAPTNLKVYHLPIAVLTASATLPQYLTFLPYLRNIVIREQIEILHGHATLSSLAHEAMFHAAFFDLPLRQGHREGKARQGIRTVFTDHSLFELDSAVGVLTNKLLAGALRNADAVICVSHAGRENTALRAQLDPHLVHVIPNSIVPRKFTPNPALADPSCITVVVISRLVYRKGIDLLVAATPHICKIFPDVRFIIGGDGPKMVELEQMREMHLLQDRIELLGSVPPGQVGNVLNRGQIYLSTSLTEAFGTSIIEAASTGLFIVSTKVGGVPEILPEDMIEFARPDADDIINALGRAIDIVRSRKHDPFTAHERLRDMYSWATIAERTERVYDRVLAAEDRSLFERMARLLDLGMFYGPILCIITAVQGIFLAILDWLQPRDLIDIVPDMPRK